MRKHAIALLSCCCFVSFSTHARENCISGAFEDNLNQREEVTSKVDECPNPKEQLFEKICTMIESQDSSVVRILEQMSCADEKKDTPKNFQEKVAHMMEKYRNDFGCDSSGFTIEMGNVLKYSVYRDFPMFVDSVVRRYNLDINFKDPADGKTLLDFVKDEIARFKKMGGNESKVRELEDIYGHFKNDLKAKHSHEL